VEFQAVTRDKQARAARRAAERAELERRRLEARANRTWADDAREVFDSVTESDIEHAARHMQVSDDFLRELDRRTRPTHTVTYTASYTRGETIPVRRG
jgi:hypothetical protein